MPQHGKQEDRFVNGNCREYCDMLLPVFCGRMPMMARLRGGRSETSGLVQNPARLVERARAPLPHNHIGLRINSSICQEPVRVKCESAGVDRVIGLARAREAASALLPIRSNPMPGGNAPGQYRRPPRDPSRCCRCSFGCFIAASSAARAVSSSLAGRAPAPGCRAQRSG